MNLISIHPATHPAHVVGTGRNLYIAYVTAQCLVGVCYALTALLVPHMWMNVAVVVAPLALIVSAVVLTIVSKMLWKRMWWFIPYSRQRPADEPFAGAVTARSYRPWFSVQPSSTCSPPMIGSQRSPA